VIACGVLIPSFFIILFVMLFLTFLLVLGGLCGFGGWDIGIPKGCLDELDYSDGVVDLRNFPLPIVLKIGGVIGKPPQIISNQMDLLAALAPDKHHPPMIGIFGE
jgi:hypothetical protein